MVVLNSYLFFSRLLLLRFTQTRHAGAASVSCPLAESLVDRDTPERVTGRGYDVLTIGSGDVTFMGMLRVSRAYSPNVSCIHFFLLGQLVLLDLAVYS